MHSHLQNIAIVAYVCAMGLALTHLVQRHGPIRRPATRCPLTPHAALGQLTCGVAHPRGLVMVAPELARPPLGTLPNAVSVVVWVVVLLEMLVERHSGVTVLGAFVMPVVVVLSLKSSVARPA